MNKIIQIKQDDDIRCVVLSQREFSEFFDIAVERDTEFVFSQDIDNVSVYFWYADLDRVADIYFEVCDPIEYWQSTCILPIQVAVENTFTIGKRYECGGQTS